MKSTWPSGGHPHPINVNNDNRSCCVQEFRTVFGTRLIFASLVKFESIQNAVSGVNKKFFIALNLKKLNVIV